MRTLHRDLDNYRGGRYGGSSVTLLSGRIYPRGVFNWQFSPSVQSTQLIHRCWDDTSSKKKKSFCHTWHMNTMFMSMERWNQKLVLPVGVNCTKIHPLFLDQQESRRDHKERMWPTWRQQLRVSEQRTKRGEEKGTMISFHHSVFLHTRLELSSPCPPQGQKAEAGFSYAFRFLHCCLQVRTELLWENIGSRFGSEFSCKGSRNVLWWWVSSWC